MFIDETWAATNTARRYGWGTTAERVVGAVPHGHWKVTTFVAALRATGLTAPMVVDGAINGGLFRAYVDQILAPTLQPGDVVVLDNLGSHKYALTRHDYISLTYLPVRHRPVRHPRQPGPPRGTGCCSLLATCYLVHAR